MLCITWIERNDIIIPPGPWVSWPITPWRIGISSSACSRISKPPGRKLDSTASTSVRPAR